MKSFPSSRTRRVTSISRVIRHSVARTSSSETTLKFFDEQIGNTCARHRAYERRNDGKGTLKKDGEGPRRIWFTAVNFPTEIAIPTAFPALWFASMSYSCCFIVCNACMYSTVSSSPSLWMSETHNLAIRVRDRKLARVHLALIHNARTTDDWSITSPSETWK